MLSQGQEKQAPGGPASERQLAVNRSGATGGPLCNGPSGIPLAPQLATLGCGSRHPGDGDS